MGNNTQILGSADNPAFGNASEDLGDPHNPAFYSSSKLCLRDKGIIKNYDKCPDFSSMRKRYIVRNSFENPIPKKKYIYKKFYQLNPTISDRLHYYNLYHESVEIYSNGTTNDGQYGFLKKYYNITFKKSNEKSFTEINKRESDGITIKKKHYFTKYTGDYILYYNNSHITTYPAYYSWSSLLLFGEITPYKPLSKYYVKVKKNDSWGRLGKSLKFRSQDDVWADVYRWHCCGETNHTELLLYYYEYVMDKCFLKSYHDFLNLKIKKKELYKYFNKPNDKLALTNLIDTKFKTFLTEFLITHSIKVIGDQYITFYEIEFLDCNIPILTHWIISEKHRIQCLDICDCVVACTGKEESGNVEKKKKHITLDRGDGNLGFDVSNVNINERLFCDPLGTGRIKEFGLIVGLINPHGIAITTDLRVGDIITHINGKYLKGMRHNKVLDWLHTLTHIELIVYPKDITLKDIIPRIVKNDSNLCCICYDKEITHSFVPCGHKCICTDCSNLREWTNCPYCTTPTSSSHPIKIYEISAT